MLDTIKANRKGTVQTAIIKKIKVVSTLKKVIVLLDIVTIQAKLTKQIRAPIAFFIEYTQKECLKIKLSHSRLSALKVATT